MRKIPSLFKRDYTGTRLVYNEVVEGCEWVITGEGVPTLKIDGTSCLIQDGKLYKRYDAKDGKSLPEGFIAAQEPDSVTGHYPGWLLVGEGNEDRWHREAFTALVEVSADGLIDGTYELIGPKIQNNPHQLASHSLVQHGQEVLENVPRDFDGLKTWLEHQHLEGVVWHHPDGRMCKIKRRDFGYKWGK